MTCALEQSTVITMRKNISFHYKGIYATDHK